MELVYEVMSTPNDTPSAADDRTAGGGIADASGDGDDNKVGTTRADLSILEDAFDENSQTSGFEEMVSGRFGSDVSDEVDD